MQHINCFTLLLMFIYGSIYFSANAQVKEGKLIWKYETEGKIIGNPITDGRMVYFGSTDGSVHSLHIRDGSPVWTFKLGGRIASGPALDDNDGLYLFSGDGKLTKFSKTSGEVLWAFDTSNEEHRFKRVNSTGTGFEDIWDYYLSGPAYYNGRVYVGSSDHHIYAVDSRSGKLIWEFETEDVVHASPVIQNNILYAGSFDGFMYALNASDGTLKWKFDTIGARYFPRGVIQKEVAWHDDAIYFGSRDYNLYVLDANTGNGLWNFKADSWIIAQPVIDGEDVYFTSSDSHKLFKMNALNGQPKWEITFPLRMFSSPVIHEKFVFVGGFDGVLYGADKENGEIEWNFKTDGHKTNYSKIFQEDGTFQPDFSIYGSTIKETAANDEKLQLLGSILSKPIITGQRILFGSTDSTFYAVELPEE